MDDGVAGINRRADHRLECAQTVHVTLPWVEAPLPLTRAGQSFQYVVLSKLDSRRKMNLDF